MNCNLFQIADLVCHCFKITLAFLTGINWFIVYLNKKKGAKKINVDILVSGLGYVLFIIQSKRYYSKKSGHFLPSSQTDSEHRCDHEYRGKTKQRNGVCLILQ